MRSSTVILIIVLVVVVVGGVYYFLVSENMNNATALAPSSSSTPGVPNTGGPGTSGAPSPIINLNSTTTSLSNTYLVATDGKTLYAFSNDSTNTSNCADTCSALWPPYTVPSSAGPLPGAPGIPGQIGTTTRPDGTTQVTYNAQPLYFYAKDAKPGDTNGAKIPGWLLVRP